MDVFVLITFEVKPERCRSFEELLAQVRLDLAVVPGSHGVRIFRDAQKANSFVLLERWSSEAEHRAHLENVVRSGAWAHVSSHLAADPVSRYVAEAL